MNRRRSPPSPLGTVTDVDVDECWTFEPDIPWPGRELCWPTDGADPFCEVRSGDTELSILKTREVGVLLDRDLVPRRRVGETEEAILKLYLGFVLLSASMAAEPC